jgi:hypothetical protein
MAEASEATVVRLFQEVESPGAGGNASSCYVLGGLAFEALTAVYGQERIGTFMASFTSSRDWRANFLTVFGVEVSIFYQKLIPYLAYWGSRMV